MNVVDSCGWLEYFAAGRNADFFAEPIEQSETLLVPVICIYEVFRRLLEQVERRVAIEVLATMRGMNVAPVDSATAVAAALLGRDEKLPMADSLILACARAYKATLWTQDAHFKHIEGVKYIPAR